MCKFTALTDNNETPCPIKPMTKFEIQSAETSTIIEFVVFEDKCRGDVTLSIVMSDASDEKMKMIREIDEITMRQLAAYLEASLPKRRY